MRSSLGRVLLLSAVRVHGAGTWIFNILDGLVPVVQTGRLVWPNGMLNTEDV